jgi:glycosyltransferase involved in cell wall biosynthesis
MSTPTARICFATNEYPPHVGTRRDPRSASSRASRAPGFDIVVFSAFWGDHACALPPMDGRVPVHWLPPDLELALRAIEQEDRTRPFDLFHGFMLSSAYPCLASAAVADRPVVASIRGVDGKSFDEVTTQVIRRARWVTLVSSDSLARAAAVCDLSGRSSVIPNGVDLDAFTPWSATAANEGVVGTAAVFRRKKNIPLLIRAYARLPRVIQRRLLLVGDAYAGNAPFPAGRQAILDLVDALGVRQETEITGFVEHEALGEYHRRMRLFVLSSDHEGMPNAVLEAAASGLPIVTTAVDGVKDVLTPGVDALFVPPNDVDALAEALQRILIDPELASALSCAARATATRLSLAAELERYVDLYASLLAAPLVPPSIPPYRLSHPGPRPSAVARRNGQFSFPPASASVQQPCDHRPAKHRSPSVTRAPRIVCAWSSLSESNVRANVGMPLRLPRCEPRVSARPPPIGCR